jgi:hypothetical protein
MLITGWLNYLSRPVIVLSSVFIFLAKRSVMQSAVILLFLQYQCVQTLANEYPTEINTHIMIICTQDRMEVSFEI